MATVLILKRTYLVKNCSKYFVIFGLSFAQISNIFYWGIIPLPELFDIFLLFSLFLVILEENEVIKPTKWLNYLLFLGSFNNFLVTYFFFLWSFLQPEKDLNFIHLFGFPEFVQIYFDSISLFALLYVCKKYKDFIELSRKNDFNKKVLLMELLLIISIFIL